MCRLLLMLFINQHAEPAEHGDTSALLDPSLTVFKKNTQKFKF